jgi:hypothetical protein
MMKKDYVYIGIPEDKDISSVLMLQDYLRDTYSIEEYANTWSPHITICYGNMLSEDEAAKINLALCEITSRHIPMDLVLEEAIVKHKNTIR